MVSVAGAATTGRADSAGGLPTRTSAQINSVTNRALRRLLLLACAATPLRRSVATDVVDRRIVDRSNPHRHAEGRGMHHHAVADVDGHVRSVRVVRDQVAGLDLIH